MIPMVVSVGKVYNTLFVNDHKIISFYFCIDWISTANKVITSLTNLNCNENDNVSRNIEI